MRPVEGEFNFFVRDETKQKVERGGNVPALRVTLAAVHYAEMTLAQFD
jgi:hypothetical protein